MFWAQMVSRMQEFYVSTVALIFEILWKIYATEFSYLTYHRQRCIASCDFVNGWASFSAISATLSAGERDNCCYEYAVRATP